MNDNGISNYYFSDIRNLTSHNIKLRSVSLFYFHDVIKNYFPQNLTSSDNFLSLNNFFHAIPLIKTNMVILEKKLDVTCKDLDISISVDPSVDNNEVSDLINSDKKISSLNGSALDRLYWSKIVDFAKDWSDSNTELHNSIREVWLEFDSNSFLSTLPVPCLFLDTKMVYNKIPLNLESLINILIFSLNLFSIEKKILLKQIKNNFLTCLNLLPSDAKITSFGFMLNRQPFSVRVLIDIEPEKTLEFLTKLRIKFDRQKFNSLIDNVKLLSRKIILALNIGNTIENIFGLECFLKSDYGDEKTLYFVPMLEYLKRINLCKEFEYREILKFQGSIINNFYVDNTLKEEYEHTAFDWGINHIKIVGKDYNTLYAKIYYYISYLSLKKDTSSLW